jgi:hypothetical protein
MTISLESSDRKRLSRLRGMSDEELIRIGKAARSYAAIRRARENRRGLAAV